jgi:hypothetical protein
MNDKISEAQNVMFGLHSPTEILAEFLSAHFQENLTKRAAPD